MSKSIPTGQSLKWRPKIQSIQVHWDSLALYDFSLCLASIIFFSFKPSSSLLLSSFSPFSVTMEKKRKKKVKRKYQVRRLYHHLPPPPLESCKMQISRVLSPRSAGSTIMSPRGTYIFWFWSSIYRPIFFKHTFS